MLIRKLIITVIAIFIMPLVCFADNVSKTSQAQADTTASLDDDDEYLDQVGIYVPDPIEGFNRVVFYANDKIIKYAARPISDAYTFITPRPVRTGLKNFFHNLLFPVRFVNNALQGKFKAAGVEFSLFILNSTAGIGGFIDVGKNHKPIVPVHDEDLGQTFGVWGVGEGFYVVIPFLGPSTLRDSVGMVGDFFLDPLTYVKPDVVRYSAVGIRAVNGLDDILDRYDAISQNAVEPYSSFKNAYIQHRRALIEK